MSINYNNLVPACYAIANANDVDLGVGDSMLQDNIRCGEDKHKGATVLPKEFRPDWAKLHEENPDLALVNNEYNAYIRKRQALMTQLKPLWNSGDYQGMIDLMEATEDPGPVSVPAREEWEKEQNGGETEDTDGEETGGTEDGGDGNE